MRDVVLSPISILAAVAGLIAGDDHPGRYFHRLLKLGPRSDRWINLFGAAEHYEYPDQGTTDHYVKRLESLILEEFRKGGVVKDLKEKTDQLLDRISRDSERINRQAP